MRMRILLTKILNHPFPQHKLKMEATASIFFAQKQIFQTCYHRCVAVTYPFASSQPRT